MNYKDIVQLKHWGNYTFDTQLSDFAQRIRQWELEDGLQLNPDFQRGHIWTLDQQTAFVEFILRGGKSHPFLFNHPGWMKDFKGDFVCVDGLQRITALNRFLDNELPVFGGNYLTDIEDINTLLKRSFVKVYINDLKTKAEVLEWYIEINSGGTAHTEEELSRVRKLYLQEINGQST